MAQEIYDIIIVGSGPGGYVAAEKAGKAGLSVLLVEREKLGGVCLNRGCIPTKCLLQSAKQYSHAMDAGRFGVHMDNLRFDVSEAMKRKNDTVAMLGKGVASLMKQAKVTVVTGEAAIPNAGTVEVGDRIYRGGRIIIATGSSPSVPPIPGVDSPLVITSREALDLETLPGRIVIIGGGVIGLEFASFFSALGTEVHIVEMMDEVCPMMDGEIAKALRVSLGRITFHLSSRVTAIDNGRVTFISADQEGAVTGDLVLMSVGRKPNIGGITIPGLDMDGRGVKVNDRMETNIPNVYAIGDVTGRSLLAHSASRMAEVVVDTILGGSQRMRFEAVPWALYTNPEAAGCGLTQDEAGRRGYAVRVGKVKMRTNGRFLAEHNAGEQGICKVIADGETGTILGVHMLGPYASEIIHSAAVMMEAELRVHEIREIIFPHPSVSEVLREAAAEIADTAKE